MMIENTTDPIAAIQRNQSSLPIAAKISTMTEKSRLATFFSMKSDQAACTGVFQPLADLIFCARVTSQNESPFPTTAAAPRASGTQAPSLPARCMYCLLYTSDAADE